MYAATSLAGCSIYLSRQSSSTHTKSTESSSARKTPAEITEIREDQPQDAHKPVTPASMATGGEATPDIRPTEIAISRAYEKTVRLRGQGATENEERIAMVMEYIHFIMPRIADKETVNTSVARSTTDAASQLQAQADKRRPTKDISNIPPAISWNISERFMYKKYYTGTTVPASSAPFSTEFADTDIATIKNFKVEPLKTLIPIDEPKTAD